MEGNKENKSSVLSIVTLVISIVVLLFLLIYPSMNYLNIITGVSCLIFIVLIILGIIALKKSNKGCAIATIIISALGTLFALLAFVGNIALNDLATADQVYCPTATECVKGEDGISTCNFSGLEIKCTTDKLQESQFKGE